MTTRTKTFGLAAAITAIAVAVPTGVQAYADPTPPSTPAAPTTSQIPVPTATNVPDPVGSGCGEYRSKAGTGAGSFAAMAAQTATQAIANNPDLSTFSGLISGKVNPDVNILSVIDGGPYVVFAPTNAAFAKVDPATMETLKTDPVKLVPVLFYHLVLGYLNPNDVAGKMPTQDGRPVVVTGKGGDVKVNDAKIVCAYPARGSYIYMIDTVLTPPTPAAEAGTSTTATTSGTSTSGTSTSATTSAATSASETASTSAAPSTSASASSTAASSASATTAASTPASASESASATTASASPTTTTAKPAA